VTDHDLGRSAKNVRTFQNAHFCRWFALRRRVTKAIWLLNHHFGRLFPLDPRRPNARKIHNYLDFHSHHFLMTQ